MRRTIKKIGDSVGIYFAFILGIAFFGWLAGALTIWFCHALVPTFPMESVMPPMNNIADWRSLLLIAIGCVAFLSVRLMWSMVSRPLGNLIEKGFVRWDVLSMRHGPIVKWSGQFILSKPTPNEIQAAQSWAAQNKDFDRRIMNRDYKVSYEADQHAITLQKKSLPSYSRLKKASKIRHYFIGIPICFLVAAFLLFGRSGGDADDQETPDRQEVVDYSAYGHWFENPLLQRWWWNITLVCSAVGFPIWAISYLSEKRYLKMLGADVRCMEADDEIYVADPTNFESWRQAFIDHHGHDMSVEQEKKLRAEVDKVIDAYEQEHAASRKLYEKIDEHYPNAQ